MSESKSKTYEELQAEWLRWELQKREEARGKFSTYLDYISPSYTRKWFHTLIADKCQSLYDGTLGKDRLMVFVPPQFGKSEIVSRKFSSWALGQNPKLKIVGTSYSADLASKFALAIQRTMDEELYQRLFPQTRINQKGEQSGYIRNVDYFETIGFGGYYKAVGVGGGLTGTAVDIGIIDDPVKDAMEAYSETYRERVWNWYTDVFLTRLHNKSKQLFIMTRWHDDDLAGRLLKREPEKWEVVSIPAIKENNLNPNDPRQIGESLWEEMHSLEQLKEQEKRSPRTFSALYQQHPTIEGGNIVKNEWFKIVNKATFNRFFRDAGGVVNFFIDTAYTEDKKNDPTGIIATAKIGNIIYICGAEKVNLKFPDLIRWLPSWCKENGYTSRSRIYIEPKANGISVVDQLKESTDLNVMKTPIPKESKETRLFAVSPVIEAGRVYLVEDIWNEAFIDEICGFPAKAHDEYVDILGYAINFYNGKRRTDNYSDDDMEALLY